MKLNKLGPKALLGYFVYIYIYIYIIYHCMNLSLYVSIALYELLSELGGPIAQLVRALA